MGRVGAPARAAERSPHHPRRPGRPGARRQRLSPRPASRRSRTTPAGPRSARRSTGGVGVATRRSETVGRRLMYVAVPGGPGAVRVAADLAQVDATVRRAQGAVAGAALLALARRHAPRPHRRPLGRPAAHRHHHGRPRDRRGLAAALPPLGRARRGRAGPVAAPDAPAAGRPLRRAAPRAGGVGARWSSPWSRASSPRTAGAASSPPTPPPAACSAMRPPSRSPTCRSCSGSRPRARWWMRCSQGSAVQDRQVEMDDRVAAAERAAASGRRRGPGLHDLTEVRRLEAVRRDFVANVSHELKTPLTSISGYAETLLSDSARPGDDAAVPHAPSSATPAGCSGWWTTCSISRRIESGRWQPAPHRARPRRRWRASRWAALAARADARPRRPSTSRPQPGRRAP